MSRSRTLAQLRQDIADRLDVPLFTANTHITVTTMDRWINQSVRRYVSMLLRSHEDYFITTVDFQTVAQQDEYPLPVDYMRTLYLRTEVAGNSWKIKHASIELVDRQRRGQIGWNSGFHAPFYKIWGNNLLFIPVPIGIHTVTHGYVSQKVVQDVAGDPKEELVVDDDKVEGWNGWEEWIVLDCSRKARELSEIDAGNFVREQNAYQQEITDDASRRDLEPKRIKNTWDQRGRTRIGHGGG